MMCACPGHARALAPEMRLQRVKVQKDPVRGTGEPCRREVTRLFRPRATVITMETEAFVPAGEHAII